MSRIPLSGRDRNPMIIGVVIRAPILTIYDESSSKKILSKSQKTPQSVDTNHPRGASRDRRHPRFPPNPGLLDGAAGVGAVGSRFSLGTPSALESDRVVAAVAPTFAALAHLRSTLTPLRRIVNRRVPRKPVRQLFVQSVHQFTPFKVGGAVNQKPRIEQ